MSSAAAGFDPATLAAAGHDPIIVGGGIYGIACAFEAARAGLRPLVLERAMCGDATSGNSLCIVHGGLRYLQSLDLPRFRQSHGERAWFLARFPELVRPLDCLMPLYGRGLRRPLPFRLAFLAERLLAAGRRDGLAHGRVLDAAATRARCPQLPAEGLLGSAVWQDARMADDRALLQALSREARAAGAVVVERTEVVGAIVEDGRMTGLRVRLDDRDAIELPATLVLNCAGPWARALAARLDRDRPELFHPSLAFNLHLDRPPPCPHALALEAPPPEGGTYFLVPDGERVLVGTHHLALDRPPGPEDRPQVPEAAIAQMLTALNRAMPALALTMADVGGVRAGFLPAARPGASAMAKRPVILDHGIEGGPEGLISVSGVKWTTARLVAAEVIAGVVARRAGAAAA